MKDKLLFDEIYFKTQNLGRTQFVKLLQNQEIQIMELKKEIRDLKRTLKQDWNDLTFAYLMGICDGKESAKEN